MADRRYILEILIEGRNTSTPALRSFSGALDRISHIVSGILIAGGVRRLGDWIRDLGAGAFESTARLERMTVSLQNFIAGELARGQIVQETSTAIKHLSEVELDELKSKQEELNLLNAKSVWFQERLTKAVEKYGEESYQALKINDDWTKHTSEIVKLQDEIGKLAALEGSIVTTTKDIITGQMDFKDALQLAQGPAQELFRWIEKLSVRSPFSEEAVMAAFRASAAYGFAVNAYSDLATQEERVNKAREDGVVTSQRLTLSLLDLIAATGLPSEYINNIAFAIGQVRAKGKLAAEEIRQFVNAGIGIELMARAMNMTVSEFKQLQEKGGISAEEFLPNLVEYIENNFAGASERLLDTIGGMKEGITDAFQVLLRDLTGGIFEELKPEFKDLFEFLTADETRDRAREIGEALGQTTREVLDKLDFYMAFFEGLTTGKTDLTKINFGLLIGPDAGQHANDFRDALIGIDEALINMGFDGGLPDVAINAGKGILALILGRFAVSTFLSVLTALSGLPGVLLAISGASAAVGVLIGTDFEGIGTAINIAWNDSIKDALDELKEYLETKLPGAASALEGLFDPIINIDWDAIRREIITTSIAFERWAESLNEVEGTEVEKQPGIFDAEFWQGIKIPDNLLETVQEQNAEATNKMWQGFWEWMWIQGAKEGDSSKQEVGMERLRDGFSGFIRAVFTEDAITRAFENLEVINRFNPYLLLLNALFPRTTEALSDLQAEGTRTVSVLIDSLITSVVEYIKTDATFEGVGNEFEYAVADSLPEHFNPYGWHVSSWWVDMFEHIQENSALAKLGFFDWWQENIVAWWAGLWTGVVDENAMAQARLDKNLRLIREGFAEWKEEVKVDIQEAKTAFVNFFIDVDREITNYVNEIIEKINRIIAAFNSIPGLPNLPSIPNVGIPGTMGGVNSGGNSSDSKPGRTSQYNDNSTTYISNNSNSANAVAYAQYQRYKNGRIGDYA